MTVSSPLDTLSVGDFFGHSQIEGEVGVEIEIESSNRLPHQENIPRYWVKMHDGSLRGLYNGEYVLKRPKKEADAYRAIDYLSRKLPVIDDSVRAGVHVHINVRELSFLQLWTFVSCYYILENLLTDWCGEGRQGNHFCLRASDADVVLQRLVHAVHHNSPHLLDNDSIRYAALNFNALRKFGSLEFRQLRTPLDFNVIKTWVSILLNIKRNSSLFLNPRAVVENFSLGGEEGFLQVMLGEHAQLFSMDNNKMQSLRSGVIVAQEIAYTKEW